MKLKTLALVSLAIGAAYGCFILSVAFHRNHHDFFDTATGAFHFDNTLLLFLMVLAQVSIGVFAIGAFIRWTLRHWRQRPQPSHGEN